MVIPYRQKPYGKNSFRESSQQDFLREERQSVYQDEDEVVYNLYGSIVQLIQYYCFISSDNIWHIISSICTLLMSKSWLSEDDEYDSLHEIGIDYEEDAVADEYLRHKRFYPVHVNVGCIKGAKCCADPKCRPFCSLCYGK